MIDAAAYVRRETLVSVIINTVLSLIFFLLVFGWVGPVRVWGVGGYAFDFLPQGFMIALMATLVPGMLARTARLSGRVASLAVASRLPANLAARAILLGVIGAGIGVAGAAIALEIADVSGIAWGLALCAKLAFGAALAAIVTPTGLRAALGTR